MNVIVGNLKIKDGGLQLRWILAFAIIRSLGYIKFKENT